MYELIQLTKNDYYIDCPAKMGVVKTGENAVILIDSGSDKDAGKKALRAIEANGWQLKAVFNTHSHADHIGGNRFLQEKTGCPVYAAGMECVYANSPLLEPTGLYGGLPFKDLRHKFLLAQESSVQPLTEEVLPAGIQLLRFPGHSPDMVGFLTAGGTAYIADTVCSEETLEKYGFSYLWNPEEALASLQALKTLQAARFVPAHAPVTENILPLAERNIASIEGVFAKVPELCETPAAFEQILKRIFDAYHLTMTAQQYALIGSTLRGYLSCLYGQGKLQPQYCENTMLWARTERK